MNLFAKQKQRRRCREQTCGHQGGEEGAGNELGDWDQNIFTTDIFTTRQILIDNIDN